MGVGVRGGARSLQRESDGRSLAAVWCDRHSTACCPFKGNASRHDVELLELTPAGAEVRSPINSLRTRASNVLQGQLIAAFIGGKPELKTEPCRKVSSAVEAGLHSRNAGFVASLANGSFGESLKYMSQSADWRTPTVTRQTRRAHPMLIKSVAELISICEQTRCLLKQ